MKKFLLAVAMLSIAYSCYAGTMKEQKKLRRLGEAKGWEWGNKDIRDIRKKMRELKIFKWQTIQQNLKIDSKELSEIIDKKIKELKLSIKTFDKLRKSAKNNMQRIRINRLENKFLRLEMKLKFMREGCPKWEKLRAEAEAVK